MHGVRNIMKRVVFLILVLGVLFCSCGGDPSEFSEPNQNISDDRDENESQEGTTPNGGNTDREPSGGGSDVVDGSDGSVDSTDSSDSSNLNPSGKPSIELPDDEF